MDTSTISPHPLNAEQLPGYGSSLGTYIEENNQGDDERGFEHPLLSDMGAGPMLPVREYTMMEFMDQVTDKERWEEKVWDEEIVGKWKGETVGKEALDFSEGMFEWCIKELRYKSSTYKTTQFVETIDYVFKSDTVVPSSLRESLVAAVKPLENIPDRDKDWHPWSNEQVLDLVHPSLYPLVYGQSKILPTGTVSREDCLRRAGEGVVVPDPEANIPNEDIRSTKFQWLPTEFSNNKETGIVRALSYINNLRPDIHGDLYSIIEQIIAKAIPLWSATLTASKQREDIKPRLQMEGNGYSFPEGVPENFECDLDDPEYNEKQENWENSRAVLGPEPYLSSIEDLYVDIKPKSHIDLSSIPRLQIIVKLANIHLTPEKPKYEGGSWHIEGQVNEEICASALYYYSSSNITPSYLSFRKDLMDDCEVDLPYEQDDHRALMEIYGFENHGPKMQEMGKVVTSQGRLLTFPNLLQHRVEGFELEDKSQVGERKLLALFLVDPWKQIISTSQVPPQQESVWKPQVEVLGRLGELPAELNRNIMDMVDTFPVTLEKAKEQRLELMTERKYQQNAIDQSWQERTFFLCEH